ncbi:hypothetical protein ACJMK2_021049 [Sinanodonta woodiana]|uniref:Poly [ADP-ribose] polymerase n=1 Tax=Sinanodonta woodiana TaxID=1069815 RepID=A0ABD3U125_SINWO
MSVLKFLTEPGTSKLVLVTGSENIDEEYLKKRLENAIKKGTTVDKVIYGRMAKRVCERQHTIFGPKVCPVIPYYEGLGYALKLGDNSVTEEPEPTGISPDVAESEEPLEESVTDILPYNNKLKLKAFEAIGFKHDVASKTQVKIKINVNDRHFELTGLSKDIHDAKINIMEKLESLNIKSYLAPNPDYIQILNSQQLMVQGNREIEKQNLRGVWEISPDGDNKTLVVCCEYSQQDSFEKIKGAIFGLLDTEVIGTEWDIEDTNLNVVENKIREIEKSVEPFAKCEFQEHTRSVRITCRKDLMIRCRQQVQDVFNRYLIGTCHVSIMTDIADYMHDHMTSQITQCFQEACGEIPEWHYKDGKFHITGNNIVRLACTEVLTSLSYNVIISWRSIEFTGIGKYFASDEGRDFVSEETNCRCKILTKHEFQIHKLCSIALTGEGQLVAIRLTDLYKLPVDGIVHEVVEEEDLEHFRKGALFNQKILLQTIIILCPSRFRSIREIFICDTDGYRIHELQISAERQLGSQCFSIPMGTNLQLGQTSGSKPDKMGKEVYKTALKRSGVRTIPLPGDRKFIIAWGDLARLSECTPPLQADIIVNPSTTFPVLTGRIADGLKAAASSKGGCDLESECKKMEPCKGLEKGSFVATDTPNMSCSQILHLRIEGDQSVINEEAFEQELMTVFAKRPHRLLDNFEEEEVMVRSDDDHATSTSYSNIKVKVLLGKLEDSKADVIVNTTSSFPNLHGVIAQSLCKVAGLSLQSDCYSNYPNGLKDGAIASTSGGNLNCIKVFHIKLSEWSQNTAKSVVEESATKCLDMLYSEGLHSIAFPAIGTGGFNYPVYDVASAMLESIKRFGKKNPGYILHVAIVIYPTAQAVNQAFNTIFSMAFHGVQGDISGTQMKEFQFAADDEENDECASLFTAKRRNIVPGKRDFVLVKLISDSNDNTESAFQYIKGKLERDFPRHEPLENLAIGELRQHDIQEIETKCAKVAVEVQISKKNKKIFFWGTVENVKMANREVLQVIKARHKFLKKNNTVKLMKQYYEWCYEETDNIVLPYSHVIGFDLESAFIQHQKTCEFVEDGLKYCVDFSKLMEFQVGKKSNIVKVVRKDRTRDNIQPLPDEWSEMDNTNCLDVIELKRKDKEYLDVKANFRGTLGSLRIKKIHKIKRIQNTTLYQLYALEKKLIQIQNTNLQSVEMTLWHGTAHEHTALINRSGFNRSFAGQTHGTVWYGMGVYFSTRSEYGCDDVYAKRDVNGHKYIYQCKVITGNSTIVPKGYDKKFPPYDSTTGRNFDSTSDPQKNEYVIFSDTQAYPEYLIEFE